MGNLCLARRLIPSQLNHRGDHDGPRFGHLDDHLFSDSVVNSWSKLEALMGESRVLMALVSMISQTSNYLSCLRNSSDLILLATSCSIESHVHCPVTKVLHEFEEKYNNNNVGTRGLDRPAPEWRNKCGMEGSSSLAI